MLLRLDPGVQPVRRVARDHGNHPVAEHRAAIDLVGDQMDGAAGLAHPRRQSPQVAAAPGHEYPQPERHHSPIKTSPPEATTLPTSKASPSSARSAEPTLAASTTAIIPRPMLKVRQSSTSGTNGVR